MAHETHWGEELDPALRDLSRLAPEECALFDDLRYDRIRENLRLEQERAETFSHLPASTANIS